MSNLKLCLSIDDHQIMKMIAVVMLIVMILGNDDDVVVVDGDNDIDGDDEVD